MDNNLKWGNYGGNNDGAESHRATGKWTGVFVAIIILLAMIVGLCSFLKYRRVEHSWRRRQNRDPPPNMFIRMIDRAIGVPGEIEQRIAMTRLSAHATPREVFEHFPVFVWKNRADSGGGGSAQGDRLHSSDNPDLGITQVLSQTRNSEAGSQTQAHQQSQSQDSSAAGPSRPRATRNRGERSDILRRRSSVSRRETSTERPRPLGPTISSQDSCSICLDSYVHNETLVCQLPCNHIYHVSCIERHLVGYRASERQTEDVLDSEGVSTSVDANAQRTSEVNDQHAIEVENPEIGRMSQGSTLVRDQSRVSNEIQDEIQAQQASDEMAALSGKPEDVKDTPERSDEVEYFDPDPSPSALVNQIQRSSVEISNSNRRSRDSGTRSHNSRETRVRSRSVTEAEIQEVPERDIEHDVQHETATASATDNNHRRNGARNRILDRILGPEVEFDRPVYQGSTQCPVCKTTVFDPDEQRRKMEATWYRRWYRRIGSRLRN